MPLLLETEADHHGTARRASLERWGVCIGFLIAAVFTAWFFRVSRAEAFHSDAAITVLMANDRALDLFRAYFYGQDRFGALPFLCANFLGRLWGTFWTPDGLSVFRTVWFCLGVIPFAALWRLRWHVAVGGYALVPLLIPWHRTFLFDLSQPYAFQLPVFLGAWWAIRKSCESNERWRPALLLSGVSVSVFAATWASTTSGPLLVALVAVESLRNRALGRDWYRPGLSAMAAAVVGIGLEGVLRAAFHRFSEVHFSYAFRTSMHIVWAELPSNVSSVLLRMSGLPAVVAVLGVGVALFGLWELARTPSRPRSRERVDGAALMLGLGGAALLQVGLIILVSHFRANEFHPRFFSLVFLFFAWAILGGLAHAVSAAKTMPAVLLAFFSLVVVPRPQPNEQFDRQAATARALEVAAPGAVLINGFWGTYVYTALAPKQTLIALPADGEYQRSPWAISMLQRPGATVLLGNEAVPGAPALITEALVVQHGAVLSLEAQAVVSDGARVFSRYRVLEQLGISLDPPLENDAPCLRRYVVSFPDAKPSRIVIALAKGRTLIVEPNTDGPTRIELAACDVLGVYGVAL